MRFLARLRHPGSPAEPGPAPAEPDPAPAEPGPAPAEDHADRQASTEKGYTVFDEQQAFTLQNPAYFRADLRLSLQWNRKNRTSTLSLDIQNLTNRLNVSNQRYDEEKQTVVNTYQTGLIPILNYKLEF